MSVLGYLKLIREVIGLRARPSVVRPITERIAILGAGVFLFGFYFTVLRSTMF